jgi:hypothetical protein
VPWVATTYAAVLLVANGWLELQSQHREQVVLARASTDIAHLVHDAWVVLPESALWTTGYFAYWVVACFVALAMLERLHGPLTTVLVAVAGHVVGTAVSEGVVAIRIAAGNLPDSARHALDVGPSFVLLAATFAVIAGAGSPRWARLLCVLVLLPLAAWEVSTTRADPVGHAAAATVGVVAARLLRARRTTAADRVVT